MSDNVAKKTDCNCSKCAALCLGRPGIFAPGEATRAAAHFGLTLQEFFKRSLTINYQLDNDDRSIIDFLSPAWTPRAADIPDPIEFLARLVFGEAPSTPMNGRRVTMSEGFTYGRCALLGEKGCMLPFELRPIECRAAYACERGDPVRGKAHHEAVVEEWSHAQTSGELAELAKNK